jgi:hypothetical protein
MHECIYICVKCRVQFLFSIQTYQTLLKIRTNNENKQILKDSEDGISDYWRSGLYPSPGTPKATIPISLRTETGPISKTLLSLKYRAMEKSKNPIVKNENNAYITRRTVITNINRF